MQRTYEKLGYEAVTLRYRPEAKPPRQRGGMSPSEAAGRCVRKLQRKLFRGRIAKREANFNKFNEECLSMSRESYTDSSYMQIPTDAYDFFSVGSDQVWNTSFYDFTRMYLLDFVTDDSRKIAYAASFGTAEAEESCRELFAENLKRFKSLSVREADGARIVCGLCGRKAQVVLDPTLLLERDDWERLIGSVRMDIPERYALTYFMGTLSGKHKKRIKSYAKAHGLELVMLNELQSPFYSCGPKEFVYLIRHAAVVFTDSYHACCLSYQFLRPFWVFERVDQEKDMSSRINTFLEQFGFQSRLYRDGCDLSGEPDTAAADERLARERKESMRYLLNALR